MRKLLVLDLDETLIFATETPLARACAFRVGPYHVYRRPHVEAFLRTCARHFDIAVWTASTSDYAAPVIAELFEEIGDPLFVWARDRCTRKVDYETRDEYRLKDLKKVRAQGFSLDHVLAIDDTARNYERSYGNLIVVREFKGDENDTELELLAEYLVTLASVPNVRAVEKRGWRRQLASLAGRVDVAREPVARVGRVDLDKVQRGEHSHGGADLVGDGGQDRG